MRSKKQKMMRLTSMAVAARLNNILIKDFSESLSSLIIKQNFYKHGLKSKELNNGGKTKAVNSIVSDYKAIKPIGSVSVVQLKKDLRLAIK
jgi:hypothetical protein